MSKLLEKIIDKLNLIPDARWVNGTSKESFILYLKNNSDFVVAPASSRSHWNYPGGLINYSARTMSALAALNKMEKEPFKEEELVIPGLFFAIGKTNFYERVEEKATPRQVNYIEDLFRERVARFEAGSDERKHYQTFKDRKLGMSSGFASAILNKMLKDADLIPDVNQIQDKIFYKVREDAYPLPRPEMSLKILRTYLVLSEDEEVAIRYYNSLRDDEKETVEFANAVKRYRLLNMLIAASWYAFSKGEIR